MEFDMWHHSMKNYIFKSTLQQQSLLTMTKLLRIIHITRCEQFFFHGDFVCIWKYCAVVEAKKHLKTLRR